MYFIESIINILDEKNYNIKYYNKKLLGILIFIFCFKDMIFIN